MFRAVWQYRNFILSSIKSELKGRYARSKFGAAWLILNPLAQASIFALVLSEVLGAKLPGIANKSAYAVYLVAGMAAWSLFSEIVLRCSNVFVEFSSVLKKISFPRLCLPIIVGGSALLNHVLLLLAAAVVCLFFGRLPGTAWLTLPLAIIVIAMLAFGVGLLLGIFNVFARDVGQVLAIVLQFWFWLTPVVYVPDALPAKLKFWIDLNPMTAIVRVYQDALLSDRLPDWSTLVFPVVVGALLSALAFFVFRKASPELVDAL
jgi:lipopolysaccharide transport system permease protein